MTRRKKGSQMLLAGQESETIPELESLAVSFKDISDQHKDAADLKKKAGTVLAEAMKRHKLVIYKCHGSGLTATLEEDVKIKVKGKKGEGDGDDKAGDEGDDDADTGTPGPTVQ